MNPNTDGIIDAEAEIYRNERYTTQGSYEGEAAATLAGGFTSHRPRADDRTPLLASSHSAIAWPGQADFADLPWWKRPSVYWMLPPFLLFTLAFGGTIMPKLNLINNLMCRRYFQSLAMTDPSYSDVPIDYGGGKNEQCDVPEVDKLYTSFTLACTLISGILSAVTSPKLGALSDRYGRKVIIAATTIGMLSGEIITIVAATYPETFNVYWLLLGFAIDGLSGSFIVGMAVAHSYATDCTPPNRRNVAFGYFHGCLFAGVGIGPLIFGQIVKATNSLLVIFYVALGCHVLFVLSLAFIIPESLSKRRQLAARQKHAAKKAEEHWPSRSFIRHVRHHASQFFAPLQILYPTGEGSSPALRRNLVILASVDTITFGVAMGAMTVIVNYIKSTFHWDVPQQSYYMSAVNLTRVSCLLFVLPAITRLVRGPAASRRPLPQTGCDGLDLGVIRTSILLDTLGFLGYTLAHTGGIFTAAGCIAAIGGIGGPTLQSALTKHVPHDRTGELLGASGFLHAMSRVVAPIIFSSIYYKTVDHFRQTVFLCLAITFGLAAVLSWFLEPHIYLGDYAHEDPRVSEEEAED